MAHGREGPDIVMQVRYAGASSVRSVTDHELHRVPDGRSAIDPERSHLNRIIYGPATQQAALDQLFDDGVKRPTAQAEDPYVQMVLSASPSHFREEGQGPGEFDPDATELWADVTMRWLKTEYGEDLVHASLHLDEDTPHIHALIVPTYQRKARKPGKPSKGESATDFAARVAEAEARPTIRTAGRSSSEYWSQKWCRRNARKSYHAATEAEGLGLGYGKDFVAEGQPSPQTTPTGVWVRQEAARVAADRSALDADRAALGVDLKALVVDRAKFDADAKALTSSKIALVEAQTQLASKIAVLTEDRSALAMDRASLNADAAALASGQTALAENQTKLTMHIAALTEDRSALALDRASLDVDAAALASGQTALAEGQAKLVTDIADLALRRAMLDQGWATLNADATALAETRNKQFATAKTWAERIKNDRTTLVQDQRALNADRAKLENEKIEVQKLSAHLSQLGKRIENDRAALAEDQSALKDDRAQLENEKVEVRGLSAHLSKLVKRIESVLKDVLNFGPRIRSVLQDAEASADERSAAQAARSDIVEAVPALRRDHSLSRLILQRVRRVEPSTLEGIPEPVEETGTGFGQP